MTNLGYAVLGALFVVAFFGAIVIWARDEAEVSYEREMSE